MNHYSAVLDAVFAMPTATRALRTIHKYGSFDNYLLNLPPQLLSKETTRIRDAIRSVIHAKLDSLPQEQKFLPIGITGQVANSDQVRPEEYKMGDRLVATAKARVDEWGAGAPVITGGTKRVLAKGKFGKGSHWRRQLGAVRVEGGGYAPDSASWLKLDAEGNLVQPGLSMGEEESGAKDSSEEGVWEDIPDAEAEDASVETPAK